MYVVVWRSPPAHGGGGRRGCDGAGEGEDGFAPLLLVQQFTPPCGASVASLSRPAPLVQSWELGRITGPAFWSHRQGAAVLEEVA